jgi:hypothetical protein
MLNNFTFNLTKLSTSASYQHRSFTRAFKKVILQKDVDNLGFRGEICFVKPGHALNYLVP